MCSFVPQTILTFSAADEGRKLKVLSCEARAFPVGTTQVCTGDLVGKKVNLGDFYNF